MIAHLHPLMNSDYVFCHLKSLSESYCRAGEPQVNKYLFQEGYLWNKFMINELLSFREKLDEKDRKEMDLCCFFVCI